MSVNPNPKPIGILIVEDHTLTNECLKIGLEKEPEFKILGQAYNGLQAVELAQQLKPDVILMDIRMPEMNGVQATVKIKQHAPGAKVIMATSIVEKNAVKAAFAAKADAYCTKGMKLEDMKQVILSVMGGSMWLDPQVARFVIEEMMGIPMGSGAGHEKNFQSPPPKVLSQQTIEPTASPRKQQATDYETLMAHYPQEHLPHRVQGHNPSASHVQYVVPMQQPEIPYLPAVSGRKVQDILTERELEILTLIGDRKSNMEIAETLKISAAWITGYIENILTKLAVSSEVQAVHRALNDGFLEEPALLNQVCL